MASPSQIETVEGRLVLSQCTTPRSLHDGLPAATSPRIPLIDDLTTGPVPAGSVLLVEFDAASQWYNASVTIAAGWLADGGAVRYGVAARTPNKLRSQLNRLGLDVEELESGSKLIIHDWYTCTLGQKSKEKYAMDSLKVADLSIFFSKHMMGSGPNGFDGPEAVPLSSELLRITDNLSSLVRFNCEKNWVEFTLARRIPSASVTKSILLLGLIQGLHRAGFTGLLKPLLME